MPRVVIGDPQCMSIIMKSGSMEEDFYTDADWHIFETWDIVFMKFRKQQERVSKLRKALRTANDTLLKRRGILRGVAASRRKQVLALERRVKKWADIQVQGEEFENFLNEKSD